LIRILTDTFKDTYGAGIPDVKILDFIFHSAGRAKLAITVPSLISMCGRYRLSRRKEIIEEYFGSAPWDDDWNPRYNITPTQQVPVIRQHPNIHKKSDKFR
jgi:hypothetical protein